MILVVDIGNTRIKWACVADGCLVDPGEAVHAGAPDRALQSLDRAVPARMAGVIAVNVAGDAVASALAAFVRQRWDAPLRFVTVAREAHGVRCGYADPSRLGADRWVASIAAHRLAGGAACVIDAGTAVTLDAVDAEGRHLGGLIVAGPEMVAAALDRDTDGIGRIDVVVRPDSGRSTDSERYPDDGRLTEGGRPTGRDRRHGVERRSGSGATRSRPRSGHGADILGADTAEAVAKGAMLSLAGGLDRALAAVAASLGAPPAVYLTGGDAGRLLPWLQTSCETRPYLVLEGLMAISGGSGAPASGADQNPRTDQQQGAA